jgi:acyl-CoA synthetase (AMP-forming)/AMP-acid ligase II
VNLTVLLDMVADGMRDRILVGDLEGGMSAEELRRRAQVGAKVVGEFDVDSILFLSENGSAFPVALFAASYGGLPFLPLNYRLSQDQLGEILSRRAKPLVITDSPERVGDRPTLSVGKFMSLTASSPAPEDLPDVDPDEIAVLLMTSGTTAASKSAVLRHRHLVSYILGSVEFMGGEEADATIVSVPPYHIAAVANLLSNLYAGRRVFYLDQFTAQTWLDSVREQKITHAMVVPTMLSRIVEQLRATRTEGPPTLRSVSYGGARISPRVLAEALRLFPQTGFVNAYGLTETASSIAVLGPDDHRDALASDDASIRARLGSVGRALPSVEIEVHDDNGKPCPSGVVGEIVVRGPQVAGEYLGAGVRTTADGWFPTRDRGYIDRGGFIFVEGRADDTIIRGGENIAPSEIEIVLGAHEGVADCAVVGTPDEEWGQRVVGFVVRMNGSDVLSDELREFVRAKLRSAKTPDEILFLDELPMTPTGKVLRRDLVAWVAASAI